jgi:hypothetical protein
VIPKVCNNSLAARTAPNLIEQVDACHSGTRKLRALGCQWLVNQPPVEDVEDVDQFNPLPQYGLAPRSEVARPCTV